MNERQKRAYENIFRASMWLIGELENTLEDYPEQSEEYTRTVADLNNHEWLTQKIYNETVTENDIRFCGKDWLINKVEEVIRNEGY